MADVFRRPRVEGDPPAVRRIVTDVPTTIEAELATAGVGRHEVTPRKSEMDRFLKQVVEDFARTGAGLQIARGKRDHEARVDVGREDVYYAWFVNAPLARVDIDLNLTAPDRATNLERLRAVLDRVEEIGEGIEFPFEADEEGWEPAWTCGGFSIPYQGHAPSADYAPRAAQLMKILIERTLPLLTPSSAENPAEIIFVVKEDDSGGLHARAIGHSIFTQAETRNELEQNVRDAVRCHFEPEQQAPKLIHLHYVHDEVIAL
jgi:hypothetical protein